MTLYLVHAIDTEGPLYESLEASFERLEKILAIRLEPSRENLLKLRRKELALEGKEDAAALIVSEQLLNYNDSWDKVDAMLYEMLSPDYRQRYADPEGRGWVYSWFIVDHIGYELNPRRRDMGYHNIFDHYKSLLKETHSADEINWHFHPMSTFKEAHICATSYLRSPHLLETLARRILDRGWFPSCFRPGFHAERPDSHWFLEQWLPFDFANQATQSDIAAQQDVMGGRLGDWRRSPNDWSPYNPSHDDYQAEGNCRRTIFRCLNVGTRFKLLDEAEVERAFARAASGKPTILAFTNHDFRDMRKDIAQTYALVQKMAKRYPEVVWQNSGAKEAARAVLGREKGEAFKLDVRLEHNHVSVKANHDSFGPQPFLAIKTHDKRYLTDNFDLQTPRRHWTYSFDADSVPLTAIEAFGVASNDLSGSTHVLIVSPEGSIILDKQYHEKTW